MFTAFVVERLIQNRKKKNWTFPSILSFHSFFIIVTWRLATFVRVTGELFRCVFFCTFLFLFHAQTFLHRFVSYLLSPYILSAFFFNSYLNFFLFIWFHILYGAMSSTFIRSFIRFSPFTYILSLVFYLFIYLFYMLTSFIFVTFMLSFCHL